MTGLLSAISGQFSRSLILGALFPAAIFILAWNGVVTPLLPPEAHVPVPRILGADGSAVANTFAALVLAGLLYVLGTPLIALYEGYPWKDSPLGRWRTRVQRARMRARRRDAAVLFELAVASTAGRRRLNAERSAVRRELARSYPDEEHLVLPTRLGNVLRAFERYPSVQYGVDAIVFWPRLTDVVPDPYLTAIGDARTSLVFLLNLSFLSGGLAATTAVAGLYYLPPSPLLNVLLPVVLFALLSGWFYRRSLDRAAAWGDLVKGAFDLYRWELLRKLGYDQKPRTRAGERALWRKVTQQVMYGDQLLDLRRSRPHVDYADRADPPTRASGAPAEVALEVTRGIRARRWPGRVRIAVEVTNRDEARRTAKAVVITDSPPEGMEYVWDSARVSGAPVRVVGINPYAFHVGDIRWADSVVLTYSAVPAVPE